MTDRILLAHGSGGRLSHRLVDEAFVSRLENPILSRKDDAATFEMSGTIAFTTDSYVVNPIFFPGGDIGKLAVCGTVNDLAMSGAKPEYLSLALIIEEGFKRSDLNAIVDSIKRYAEEARVTIVAGDTKVVERGTIDKIYINTAGVGTVPTGVSIAGKNATPGDVVILSGPVGDHGIAVMSVREGLSFSTAVESDCAPLNELVERMLEASRSIHCLRDPTRGGLATTLNELAGQSGVRIAVNEKDIPVRDEVLGACEMLGLDPLYVANEGRLVAVVPDSEADSVLAAMRKHSHGGEASIIGEVTEGEPGRVVMRTHLGSTRIVDMLTGDILPRIC